MSNGKTEELHSAEGGWTVEVIHLDSDPSAWYVVQKKKFLFFRRTIVRQFFIDKAQALEFADALRENGTEPLPAL